MAFSIQTVLRQISIDLLKEYFGHKAPGEFDSIWKLPKSKQAVSITKKQAVSITKRLVEIDDDISQSISADLARIHPLSTERGRKALLNAAAGDETLSNQFGRLGNDYERALWTLMKHLEWFEYGEGLHFFDYYAEGNRGQHYRTRSNLSVSRDVNDVSQFRREICKYYRHHDGSGVSCHVDFVDRERERGLQINIFVQGLPNNATEFVNGDFCRTVSHPALEAAIMYESETGHVTTVAKGGKDVHEALRDAFAEHLLKVDPQFERVAPRRFLLDALKTVQVLAPDADLGVRAVRVRKLKLAPPNHGGTLVVEAPGANSVVGVYELGDQWFTEQCRLFEKFRVLQATISIHFQPRPNQRKNKTINLELTSPNGSNLKSLKEDDRKIAEAHIEKWNLVEPAI
jgi:hypothetical protein